MAVGIDSSKAIISSSADLACLAIELVRKGVGLGSLISLSSALSDLKALVAAAPQVMPELKDLSKQELEDLAGVAFDGVIRVLSKVRDK